MAVLDWLQQMLGSGQYGDPSIPAMPPEAETQYGTGLRRQPTSLDMLHAKLAQYDPETAGAVAASMAMEPATGAIGRSLYDMTGGLVERAAQGEYLTPSDTTPTALATVNPFSRPVSGTLFAGGRGGRGRAAPIAARAARARPGSPESELLPGESFAEPAPIGHNRPPEPIEPTPEMSLSRLAPEPGAASAPPQPFNEWLRERHLMRGDALPLSGARQPVVPPPHIQDEAAFDALAERYADHVQAGELGKDWYEHSGRAILEHTGNPELATAFAGGLARTSPQTDVASNLTHAVTAHNQAMAGMPMRAGRFPNAMGADLEKIYYEGEPVTGEKIGPFMGAVAEHFNTGLFPHHFVNDIWNMRASEYPGNAPGELYSGSPTLGEHNFTRILADRVRDVMRERTGEDWTPKQVQAAGWSGIGSLHKNIPVADAAFNFGDALRRNYAQSSWESAPGMTSGHFPEFHSAPWEHKQDYHNAIQGALTDENGRDLISSHFGLLTGRTFQGPGYFEGNVNPGAQSPVSVGMAPGGALQGVDAASQALLNTAERVRGILLRQDAVAWHKPLWANNTPITKRNFVDVDIGRGLTPDEAVAVAKAMHGATGSDFHSPIATETGFRFLNVPEYSGVPNKKFVEAVKQVAGMGILPDAKVGQASSHSFYEPNSWKDNPNGQGYRSGLAAEGSPDLQRRAAELLATLGPRIAEVDARYAAKYGWTHGPQGPWEKPEYQEFRQEVIPNPPRPGQLRRADSASEPPRKLFGPGGILGSLGLLAGGTGALYGPGEAQAAPPPSSLDDIMRMLGGGGP